MSDKYNSDKAPEPVGLYPHARKVGELLFLSGVGPRERGTSQIPGVTLDDDGNIIAYNIEMQCRSVFNNVKLILEASGSSWDQLVDVTVFLTNMKDDFKTYNRIYAEYFKDNQPCRTTVEINSLPTPIAIELKCIATVKTEKSASQGASQTEVTQAPESTPAQSEQAPSVIESQPEPENETVVIPESTPEPEPKQESAPFIEKPQPTEPRREEDGSRPRTPQW